MLLLVIPQVKHPHEYTVHLLESPAWVLLLVIPQVTHTVRREHILIRVRWLERFTSRLRFAPSLFAFVLNK